MASFQEVESENWGVLFDFSRGSRAALGLFDPTQLEFSMIIVSRGPPIQPPVYPITSICLVVIPRHRRSAHLPPDAVVGRSPPPLGGRDRPGRLAGWPRPFVGRPTRMAVVALGKLGASAYACQTCITLQFPCPESR